MSTWCIVGSGPSGREIPDTPEGLGADNVLCINDSIAHVPIECCSVYFFYRYSFKALFPAMLKQGTKLITPHTPRQINEQVPGGIAQHVERIWVGKEGPGIRRPRAMVWDRKTYPRVHDPVGPHAALYAILQGASSVHLWGVDGGDRDADGLPAVPGHAMSAEYHRCILQAAATACPDVRITQHGNPLFRLTGPNVELDGIDRH